MSTHTTQLSNYGQVYGAQVRRSLFFLVQKEDIAQETNYTT
jgi:hypothetical protein